MAAISRTSASLRSFATPRARSAPSRGCGCSRARARATSCSRPGVGNSFAWNRAETDAELLSVEKLVHLLVDVASKDGNLLLNVGPTGDGSIPWSQRERLLSLGGWLDVNGEAIFGTRPWLRAAATTSEGQELRFTRKGEAVYASLLGEPPRQRLRIPALEARPGTRETSCSAGAARSRFTGDAHDLELKLPGVGGGVARARAAHRARGDSARYSGDVNAPSSASE